MSVHVLAARARKHWAQWLPKRTAELKAEGRFGEETQAAALRAHNEINELVQQGYQVHEAEEVVLHRFILLPPEPKRDRESARMETSYQKMMRDPDEPSS